MLIMAGGTHVGKREHNEDRFVISSDPSFALVADGMGGYTSGEVASAIVAETVTRELGRGQSVTAAISRCHGAVKEAAAQGKGGAGMGAAVIAAVFDDNRYKIAWVGDCRAYLWSGELRQITRDHSYVESLLARGLISWEEAESRPDRNLITQAIGAESIEQVKVDAVEGSLAKGQELLLCSDGLNDVLSGGLIARILNQDGSAEERVSALVQAAVKAGGIDNITAVLMGGAGADHSQVPAAVSIARLDGAVEYFPVTRPVGEPTEGDTSPVVDESAKTGLYAPQVRPELDYDALPSRPSPHVVAVGGLLSNLLVGMAIGAAVVANVCLNKSPFSSVPSGLGIM